jgi:hypothetical protein
MGHVPAGLALCILFFVAANRRAMYVSDAITSETIFCALALVAILLIASALDPGASLWKSAMAGVVAGAAVHTGGTPGTGVIAAGLVTFVIGRRFRQATIFGCVSIVLAVGWWLWQRQPIDASNAVEAYYTAKNYEDASILTGSLPPVGKIAGVFNNALFVVSYPVRVFALPLPASASFPVLVLSALPFWIGFVWGLKKAPKKLMTAKVFAVTFVLMAMVWVWRDDRLLLPILPMFLLFLYWARPSPFAVCVVTVLSVYPAVLALRHQAEYAFPPAEKIEAVHAWIAANAKPGSLVLSDNDPAIFLYTGHKSLRPFVCQGPSRIETRERTLEVKAQELELIIEKYKPGYFTETGFDAYCEPDFDRIVDRLARGGRLTMLAEIAPKYRVWAVSVGPQSPVGLDSRSSDRAAQGHTAAWNRNSD